MLCARMLTLLSPVIDSMCLRKSPVVNPPVCVPSVSTMLATQRSSISGVSVDEEMTNLMGFQRAYEASAQLVTTINTLMSDTLAMKAS